MSLADKTRSVLLERGLDAEEVYQGAFGSTWNFFYRQIWDLAEDLARHELKAS